MDWVFGINLQWLVHLIISEIHEVEDIFESLFAVFDRSHPLVFVGGFAQDALDLTGIPLHQSF